MDRIKEQPNGMPLHIGDLTFMQDGIRDAIASYMNKNCVLWGCELTKDVSEFKIAEGWVLIDGEVYYVPQHKVVGNSTGGTGNYDATNHPFSHAGLSDASFLENFAFEEQISYDPDGNDNFEDGQNRDTYEIRTMEGRYQENPGPQPGDVNYLSIAGRTQEEVLLDKLWDRMQLHYTDPNDAYAGGYVKDSLEYYSYRYIANNVHFIFSGRQGEIIEYFHGFYQNPTLNTGSDNNNTAPISFFMDANGSVQIYGDWENSGGASTPVTIFTLPQNYRPQNNRRFPVLTFGSNIDMVEVQSGGDVVFWGNSGDSGVYLDNISFDAFF